MKGATKIKRVGKTKTVDDIMDQAGIPLLGLVPEDHNVVLAAAFKKPLLFQTAVNTLCNIAFTPFFQILDVS